MIIIASLLQKETSSFLDYLIHSNFTRIFNFETYSSTIFFNFYFFAIYNKFPLDEDIYTVDITTNNFSDLECAQSGLFNFTVYLIFYAINIVNGIYRVKYRI